MKFCGKTSRSQFKDVWFVGAFRLAKAAPTVIPRKRLTSRHTLAVPSKVWVLENRRAVKIGGFSERATSDGFSALQMFDCHNYCGLEQACASLSNLRRRVRARPRNGVVHDQRLLVLNYFALPHLSARLGRQWDNPTCRCETVRPEVRRN